MRRLFGPLLVTLLGVASFMVFFATASSPAATTTVSTSPSDIAAGHALFIQHCSACHALNGEGTSRAPSLINAGAAAADFYLSTGRMPLNDPHQQAFRHVPFFDEAQIAQLVAYVASLGPGPGIPVIEPVCKTTTGQPGCATLAEGQALFEINCAQCHNAVGAGGMLSKGYVIPGLKHATAVQVAEAMRVGPKPMPVFGPNQLNNNQVSAVADYVQVLRKPDDRGGIGIGHMGPIPEGFVGIIVGLGVLLVASRLIGTRG
jgi:ubiquinol-cytochrome c reductase cytochrome c subunit